MGNITAAQLLQPEGRLAAEFFPGLSVATIDEYLETYLAEGELKAIAGGLTSPSAARDAAVRAWGYYRAYDYIGERLTHSPSSVSLADQGGIDYTDAQIAEFWRLRDAALAEFTDALPEPGTSAGPTRVSKTVSITSVW